jgi:hypothetical protein
MGFPISRCFPKRVTNFGRPTICCPWELNIFQIPLLKFMFCDHRQSNNNASLCWRLIPQSLLFVWLFPWLNSYEADIKVKKLKIVESQTDAIFKWLNIALLRNKISFSFVLLTISISVENFCFKTSLLWHFLR